MDTIATTAVETIAEAGTVIVTTAPGFLEQVKDVLTSDSGMTVLKVVGVTALVVGGAFAGRAIYKKVKSRNAVPAPVTKAAENVKETVKENVATAAETVASKADDIAQAAKAA